MAYWPAMPTTKADVEASVCGWKDRWSRRDAWVGVSRVVWAFKLGCLRVIDTPLSMVQMDRAGEAEEASTESLRSGATGKGAWSKGLVVVVRRRSVVTEKGDGGEAREV